MVGQALPLVVTLTVQARLSIALAKPLSWLGPKLQGKLLPEA